MVCSRLDLLQLSTGEREKKNNLFFPFAAPGGKSSSDTFSILLAITRIGYGLAGRSKKNSGEKLGVRLSPVGDGQSLMEPLWLYGECFMALALYPAAPLYFFLPFSETQTSKINVQRKERRKKKRANLFMIIRRENEGTIKVLVGHFFRGIVSEK